MLRVWVVQEIVLLLLQTPWMQLQNNSLWAYETPRTYPYEGKALQVYNVFIHCLAFGPSAETHEDSFQNYLRSYFLSCRFTTYCFPFHDILTNCESVPRSFSRALFRWLSSSFLWFCHDFTCREPFPRFIRFVLPSSRSICAYSSIPPF